MFKNVLKALFSTFITKKKEVSYDYFEKSRNPSPDEGSPEEQETFSYTPKNSTPILIEVNKHDDEFLSYLFGKTNEGLDSNPFSDFIADKIEALLLSPKGLLKELPVMPESVITLMTELKKDDFNVMDLLQVIEKEPGMAADVIKMANSTMYRRRERTVTDLKTAFMNMGANVLLEAVVYRHLKKLSPTENIYYKNFGDKIWQHCLQTALFSKLLIDDSKGNEDKSTAYLVGLILNLGKMVIFQIMIEAFSFVPPDAQPNSQAFKKLINMYSIRLTYSIAKFWQLPDTILQVIALQDKKQDVAQNYMALAVHEANKLSELEFLLSADEIAASEFEIRSAQHIFSKKGKELAEKIQLDYESE